MAKLLANDVNQDGKRQTVTVSGIASKDSFWDTKFIGSENKPRVIARLDFCKNHGDNSLGFVPITLPVSQNLNDSGGKRAAVLVFGENPKKLGYEGTQGNVCWVEGLRTYR